MTIIIGVPKEIKNQEHRVGMVPGSVYELTQFGHTVLVQKGAGLGIGCTDEDYKDVGATIIDTPEEIFAKADMIVKVKEPQTNECKMLRKDQVLFTYLHLAPDQKQTQLLMESGCIAIAYETVTDDRGGLPLLAPMSEVAGRISIQAGAYALEKTHGGRGVLMGGIPGVEPSHVVILGGGVVGTNAAEVAMGMGARVTILDRSLPRLRQLKDIFGTKLNVIYSTKDRLEEYVSDADLVVGAVLLPGASAPRLVTKEMLKKMKKGAVIVDVAIDQGGCFETSRPTTHTDPTYVVDDIVHYCVTNMPGAVPRTSAFALNNATLPYIVALANHGYVNALAKDNHLLNGLNVHKGILTNEAVALDQGVDFVPPRDALLD